MVSRNIHMVNIIHLFCSFLNSQIARFYVDSYFIQVILWLIILYTLLSPLVQFHISMMTRNMPASIDCENCDWLLEIILYGESSM